jgi:hypothetical protein
MINASVDVTVSLVVHVDGQWDGTSPLGLVLKEAKDVAIGIVQRAIDGKPLAGDLKRIYIIRADALVVQTRELDAKA